MVPVNSQRLAGSQPGTAWSQMWRGGGRISFRSVVILISDLISMAAILNFGSLQRRTTFAGMVDNVGVALGIAAPSLAVKKVISTSGFAAAVLNFDSLPSSINVGLRRLTLYSVISVKSKSGVIENVRTAFGIASQSTAVQKLFPVPVWWPPS